MPADGVAVVRNEPREDRGGQAEPGIDEGKRPVERVRPGPAAPEGREERDRERSVHRGEQRERDGVEENGFGRVSHPGPWRGCYVRFPAGWKYLGNL